MNKQTFKIMLAYVGVLTGAGLSSGQELLQYFVSLGKTGIVGIALVGILHILIGGILLSLVVTTLQLIIPMFLTRLPINLFRNLWTYR